MDTKNEARYQWLEIFSTNSSTTTTKWSTIFKIQIERENVNKMKICHLSLSKNCNQFTITTNHKWSQTITNDHKRSQMSTNDHKWSQTITKDHKQSQRITNDHKQSKMIINNQNDHK